MNSTSSPRVAVVFTGGTIAMVFDATVGGAVPRLSGREVLQTVADHATLADLEIIEFGHYPGPHMTPPRMLELARVVAARLANPTISGVVVTHGTDTLEETAFLLSEVLPTDKPVVLVGAIHNSSEPGWDGPPNLRSALRVAASPCARGTGVLVVMNETILPGAEAMKTHTGSIDSFQARDFGPLGMVDSDRVIFARNPNPSRHRFEARIDERVESIAVAAGSDGRFVDFAREQGAQGIVLAALGRGNVPPAVLPAIQRARAAGLPVLIASRCWRGRVLDNYAYEGAGRELTRLGCILTGHLPAHKARLRLMLSLGNGFSSDQIRDAFAEE